MTWLTVGVFAGGVVTGVILALVAAVLLVLNRKD